MPLHPKVIEALGIEERRRDRNFSIYEGDKNTMEVDFGNPKGGNVVFGGKFISTAFGEAEEKELALKTNLYYSANEAEEEGGEVSMNLKSIYNFNTYKVSEFTKDTTILIADTNTRQLVQKYMQYQQKDSVLMLTKGLNTIILPTPTEIQGKIGEKNLEDMTDNQVKTHEKDDLKVYETPSPVLETIFRATGYSGYNAYVQEELSGRIASSILGSKKAKANMGMFLETKIDMAISVFCRSAISYINYETLKSYGHILKDTALDELTQEEKEKYKDFHAFVFEEDGLGDNRTIKIFEYIDMIAKKSKENKNPLAVMLSDPDKYKEVSGRGLSIKDLVMFDPQAGSADAFFRASDSIDMGENIKLWGTEFRNNIDYSENENRVEVIGGVNTSLMANSMSNVFFNKTYRKASENLLTWNNPPYSLDDGIAKASLDMYKNDTYIMGLYPTKMRNYLKNTINERGIIVEVPRSLTGYNDPKTPERFLVVIGKKDAEEAFKREHDLERGLLRGSGQTAREASLGENATHDDLLRVILQNFSSRKNDLGARVIANMEYFKDRDWKKENVLLNATKHSIGEMKKFYKNADKFSNIIQNDATKKLFNDIVQPIHIAKTEKVFQDTRFYSKTGDYPSLSFSEVVSNVPLLIYYAKSKPKIMDIIEIIAKEKDLTLPIERESINMEIFKVGERYTGEKVRVATDKLGMMKFNFYPTNFDIKDEKSRKNILKVIESIYRDNGREITPAEKADLEKGFLASSILTTKTENTTSMNAELEEYLVQYQECLVLEGDNHSVKLNVSNFDLYNKLEEMGFFDINDYIDVVELGIEKKTQIIDGFIEYIEEVTIGDIVEKLGITKEAFYATIEEVKANSKEDGITSARKISEKINEKLGLIAYTESYFDKTRKMDIDKNIKPVLEKYFGQDFDTASKEGRKKMNDFIKKVNELGGKDKTAFFNSTLNILMDKLKEGILTKYEREGRSEREVKDLNYRIVDAEEEIRVSLTELEKFAKETMDITRRLGETIYYTLPNLKKRADKAMELKEQGAPKEQIDAVYENGYEKVFRNWERNIASLMEHQIKEPENFTELEEMKTNFMLKKMRTGKTLTFVFSGFLEMLTKKNDIEMYLSASNIKDIISQLSQHIPILLPSIMVYADRSKHQLREDLTFDALYHTSAVINPLPLKGLNKQILGGGAEMEKLANSFSKEMELIEKTIDEKYPDGVTFDDMIRDHKDSPFIEMINRAKNMCKNA